MMVRRLRQFPGVADHEPVPAIEIRQTLLGGYIVLIIEYLLANDRGAEESKSSRTETIACCVNRFREGICCEELKAVAQSLIDCCLQRVVVRGSAALHAKHKWGHAEKRNSLGGIGDRVGGQPIYRIRGTGQGGLIVAPWLGKVSAFGAGVGER